MAFCTACGKELAEGAKFCENCGTAIAPDKTKRRQEYAGTVRKCPNCGEVLGALAVICPACGHELNGAEVSEALRRFIREIDALDHEIASAPAAKKKGFKTWSTGKKALFIGANLLTLGLPASVRYLLPRIQTYRGKTPKLTPAEKKKAALIENFTFPADRASLLEALIFMKSKVAFLASEEADRKTVYWLRLWTTKAEELYEKASLLLGNDEIAKSAYGELSADKASAAGRIQKRALLAVVLIVLHMGTVAAFGIFAVPRLISLLPEGKTETPYEFPETKLASLLPEIAAEAGEVIESSEIRLRLNLEGISAKEFGGYVKACKERGFSKIIKSSAVLLEAENGEGYVLRLQYYESIQELQIVLTAP